MLKIAFFAVFFSVCAPVALCGGEFCAGPAPGALESFITSHIDGARTRVWVAMYRLTSAPCARALVRAKQRGVDVRLILDRQLLSVPAYVAARRRFGQVGLVPWWGRSGSLMHHKWAVVDNAVVVGSANWTYAGLNRNREVCFAFKEVSVVQRYVTHFVVLMRRSAGLSASSPSSNGQVFFVPDHAKVLRSSLERAFDAAQRSICISMYAFTSRWCWQKIIEAAARGIMVRIMLEPTEVATPEYIASAQKAGVRLKKYASPGGVLHDKCLLIDDAVWLGSVNLTGAGLRCNDENMMVSRDQVLVKEVQTSFDRLFNTL